MIKKYSKSTKFTSSKSTAEEPSTYTAEKNTYNNYSDAFKPRKKNIVFFFDSIPKNLKNERL